MINRSNNDISRNLQEVKDMVVNSTMETLITFFDLELTSLLKGTVLSASVAVTVNNEVPMAEAS